MPLLYPSLILVIPMFNTAYAFSTVNERFVEADTSNTHGVLQLFHFRLLTNLRL